MPAHPRRAIAVLGLIAALAVALAFMVWTSDRDRPESLPVVESHGLNPDQAACLSYGIVVRHSEATDLTLRLGKYQSLDPGAAGDLQREIAAIDSIRHDHPGTDTRLVRAFDEVSAQGDAVVASADLLAYRTAVTRRSAELAESHDTCLEVADFDIETLAISETGLP